MPQSLSEVPTFVCIWLPGLPFDHPHHLDSGRKGRISLPTWYLLTYSHVTIYVWKCTRWRSVRPKSIKRYFCNTWILGSFQCLSWYHPLNSCWFGQKQVARNWSFASGLSIYCHQGPQPVCGTVCWRIISTVGQCITRIPTGCFLI